MNMQNFYEMVAKELA